MISRLQRRRWIAVASLIAAGLSAATAAPSVSTAAEPAAGRARTNVVFIVADDLGCRLGCYGDPEAKSPNIDRLAARGVRLERAYCQYPVCNPSRSSFLTGLRPDTTGILDNLTPLRTKRPEVVTLPQLFRRNGYFTASLGKIFHLGIDDEGRRLPLQDPPSWDDCRNFRPTAAGLKGEGRNLTGGKIPALHWLSAEGGDDDQPDGQIAAEAIRLLEARRDGPFFLGLGFHKPHDPFQAPRPYFDLYPPEDVRIPTLPDDRTTDPAMAISRNAPQAAIAGAEARELKRAYLAGVSFMDAQVGRVLDALDRLKLWDNTVVVFLGDHGYHLGEHGWWSKFTVFELCARAPLIVWAPGAKGMGQVAPGPVEFVDIYPTLADLCGLEAPTGLEGTSFRPLLDDPSRPGKRAAYTQVARGNRMGRSVRSDRWRYTEWDGGARGVELYDHAADPLEYRNLADDPRHAEDVAAMKVLLRAVGR